VRKKRWLILVVLLAAGGVGLWLGLRKGPTPPTPPEVSTDDTSLAAAIDKERANVIARPGDARAWGRFGQTLLSNGLPDPARVCFVEAAKLDSTEPRWPYLEGVSLLTRDPIAAIPCWQRAAERASDPELALAASFRWAEALIGNDRADEAEGILRQKLDRHADSARLYFDLGTIAAARNDLLAATNHFRQCLEDPAARRKATIHLASLASLAGKPVDAAAIAAQAEKLPPDSDWPDPYMAELAYLAVGRNGLFMQAEKEAQMGNVRVAAQMYEEVIRRYPDEARAYAKFGMLLTEQGDYVQAEQLARNGIRASPDHVQCLFILAVALFHQAERKGFSLAESQARLREAVEVAAHAVAIKQDHGFAHLYRGLALKHLGRSDDALASFREAVRCTPEEADPHLHLGQALSEFGKVQEGKVELEMAARLSRPKDRRAADLLDTLRKAEKPAGSKE
jgi:tetratricopeptide (TPR) repeat protein